MRSTIRKIGNSRGVLIPAPFLAACGMDDDVDIAVEGNALVIRSLRAMRAGWFEGYRSDMDVEPLNQIAVDEGVEEWAW
jgi:antitoxin MazE